MFVLSDRIVSFISHTFYEFYGVSAYYLSHRCDTKKRSVIRIQIFFLYLTILYHTIILCKVIHAHAIHHLLSYIKPRSRICLISRSTFSFFFYVKSLCDRTTGSSIEGLTQASYDLYRYAPDGTQFLIHPPRKVPPATLP